MTAWLRRTRTALAAAAIVAALATAYSNSFQVPFLFDDIPSIVNNRTLRQLAFVWPVLAPPGHGTTVHGRPALNLTFAVNYTLGGLDPAGYHAANLAVHTAAALALFGLARRTLTLPGTPGRLAGRATGLALATALLWALHPLQTESVTYVAQRAEALGGLLYLLVFYCAVRGSGARRPAAWYAAAATACAVGVAAKETVATAPILLALYDRAYLSPSWAEVRRRRGRLYAALAASWLLLGYLVWAAKGRGGTVGGAGDLTPWTYAGTQFGFILRYLALALWPDDLVFDYGVYVAHEPGEIIRPALAVVTLLALTGVAVWRRPRVGFLGVAVFALLAPSSSVIPVNTQTGAEHRMYLALVPLAGLSVVGVTTAASLLSRFLNGRSRRELIRSNERALVKSPWYPAALETTPVAMGATDLALAVILTGCCAAFGLRTYARNMDYHSAETIWEDAALKWPENPRAYVTLGEVAANEGRFDDALARSELALAAFRAAGKPATGAFLLKALALKGMGRLDAAEWAYGEAVAEEPEPLALSQRAKFYLDTNRPAAAVADFTAALSRTPDDQELLNHRGLALYLAGQFEKARVDLDRAVDLDPYDPVCRINRANLRIRMGRLRAAADDFTAALWLDETLTDAYLGRAHVALSEQRFDAAEADLDRAGRLNPALFQVYYLRGVVAWSRRDPAVAAEHLSEAIRRQPSFEAAYQLRAACYFTLGDTARATADVDEIKRLGSAPGPALARLMNKTHDRNPGSAVRETDGP